MIWTDGRCRKHVKTFWWWLFLKCPLPTWPVIHRNGHCHSVSSLRTAVICCKSSLASSPHRLFYKFHKCLFVLRVREKLLNFSSPPPPPPGNRMHCTLLDRMPESIFGEETKSVFTIMQYPITHTHTHQSISRKCVFTFRWSKLLIACTRILPPIFTWRSITAAAANNILAVVLLFQTLFTETFLRTIFFRNKIEFFFADMTSVSTSRQVAAVRSIFLKFSNFFPSNCWSSLCFTSLC